MIRDRFSEIATLAAGLTPEAPPPGNAFDEIQPIAPAGDMATARDTPESKRARVAIDVAVRGLTTAETIFASLDYLAGRLGFDL